MQISTFTDSEAISFNRANEPNSKKLQIAEVLEILAILDDYYRILILCISVSIMSSACTATLIFATKEPNFKCKDANGEFFGCNQVQACNNANGYVLDYKTVTMNVAFNTYCERRWMIIWGRSIIFICSSLLSTIVMCVFEKYGRRTIFMIVAITTTTTSVPLVITRGFWAL